jgi:hypothetical protein
MPQQSASSVAEARIKTTIGSAGLKHGPPKPADALRVKNESCGAYFAKVIGNAD